MIKIKLNNREYDFPTSLNEIPLGKWLELRTESKGPIDDIAILTGLDAQTVSGFNKVDDFKKAVALLSAAQANFQRDVNKAKIPGKIQLGTKIITIPKKMELEPVGAYVGVYNLIAAEKNKYEENGNNFSDEKIVADILAYYLWKPYNGEGAVFNDEAVEDQEYRDLILKLGYLDALTIAMFFFLKFPDL